MLPAYRRQEILSRLGGAGFVTVASLAARMSVDHSTIRRDLAELAREGLIRRVRGGAMPGEGHPVGDTRPPPGESERSPAIYASLTAADPAALGDAAERLVASGVDGLHLDIADGAFVPYLTFGPDLVEAIRARLPQAVLDVHLMVETPDAYFGPLARAGADRVTFHAEATRYPRRTLSLARHAGIATVGVALNPATPLDVLASVGDRLKLVNVLSTEPDVLGEAFLDPAFDRLRRVRALVPADAEIIVDGGIGPETVHGVVAAGATAVVVGRAIVRSADWTLAVRTLRAGAP